MKLLSIFIDESGDFDLKSIHSPFYLFTLVFHNQSNGISEQIKHLNHVLDRDHKGISYIHAGPLIRRENQYKHLSIDDRRHMFIQMYEFTRRCQINYKTFSYQKKNFKDKLDLEAKMAKDLRIFIEEKLGFFNEFNEIVLYYDNGQNEITRVLNTIFNYSLNNVTFKKVYTTDYKLFQASDFICTMELLELKMEVSKLSKSETQFFFKPKEPQRPYLRTMRKFRF